MMKYQSTLRLRSLPDYWMNKTHLNILFEDEWLIAIDKPAGMLVHPGREPEPDEHIALKSVRNYLDQYAYVVHRLDRPTSGVLVFTKDQKTQSKLSIQFQTWQVQKKYYAVVLGETSENDEVDIPVKRNEESEAMPSLTRYKRKNFVPAGVYGSSAFSLLDVAPHTGRYHQIRRHLAWTGFPIMGDYLYGEIETNDKNAELTSVKRMMLMSYSLEFIHPQTGKLLQITAEMPEEFKKFANKA